MVVVTSEEVAICPYDCRRCWRHGGDKCSFLNCDGSMNKCVRLRTYGFKRFTSKK